MEMMKYAVYNDLSFCQGTFTYPFLIAWMKILGSLAAELGNALFLVRYTTVSRVVSGYAAMSIVARADNYMALTL